MKLELKHLAPYLPYELTYDIGNDTILRMEKLHHRLVDGYFLHQIKPILRPLSDLNKDEWINELLGSSNLANGFKIHVQQQPTGYPDFWATRNDKWEWQFGLHKLNELFKNHFDIFGLIDNDLAIDKNTL